MLTVLRGEEVSNHSQDVSARQGRPPARGVRGAGRVRSRRARDHRRQLPLRRALEEDAAPKTIAALRTLLPLRSQLVQARWSGESAWVPMGFELELGHRARERQQLPGRRRAPPLPRRALGGRDPLPVRRDLLRQQDGPAGRKPLRDDRRGSRSSSELGRVVLWEGAQPIVFEEETKTLTGSSPRGHALSRTIRGMRLFVVAWREAPVALALTAAGRRIGLETVVLTPPEAARRAEPATSFSPTSTSGRRSTASSRASPSSAGSGRVGSRC